MTSEPSIQILDETIERADIQRIVIDDPNGNLALTIRLRDGTALYVEGSDARAALMALMAPGLGLVTPEPPEPAA